MKYLIILVGNVGSGKSTLTKEYIKKGYRCISRDAMRYMLGSGEYVYDENLEQILKASELVFVENFMKKDVPLIIDEVGMSKKVRKRYIDLGKKYEYKIIVHMLPRYSKEICVHRRMNDLRGFSKDIWNTVYDKFESEYEEPTLDEGIDIIERMEE